MRKAEREPIMGTEEYLQWDLWQNFWLGSGTVEAFVNISRYFFCIFQ